MKNFLTEWAVHYIKHKDILTERIDKINETEQGLTILNKDSTERYAIVEPFPESFKAKLAGMESKEVMLITFNSNDNFNLMLTEWNELVKFEKLTIAFVNPFSSTDTKWILSPYFHNKIADADSLKSGLKSIFSGVEQISKKEAEIIISRNKKA